MDYFIVSKSQPACAPNRNGRMLVPIPPDVNKTRLSFFQKPQLASLGALDGIHRLLARAMKSDHNVYAQQEPIPQSLAVMHLLGRG